VLSLDIHIFLYICLDDIRPDLPTQKLYFIMYLLLSLLHVVYLRRWRCSLVAPRHGWMARLPARFFFSRETSACMTIRELLRIQRGRANSCMMHVADYVIGSTRASCTFFLRGYLSFGYRCVFTNVITHPTWTRYPLDLDVR
jgi:hypothetical protein